MVRTVIVALGLDNESIRASGCARLFLRAFRIVVAMLALLFFLYLIAAAFLLFGYWRAEAGGRELPLEEEPKPISPLTPTPVSMPQALPQPMINHAMSVNSVYSSDRTALH